MAHQLCLTHLTCRQSALTRTSKVPSRIARPGCSRWQHTAASDSLDGAGGTIDHYERQVRHMPGEDSDRTYARSVERLFRYDIFPRSVMRPTVCSADRRIHPETTIVQCVALGLFHIESAVRVVRTWQSADFNVDEAGFTYATLTGHPERGISTFRVIWNRDTDRVTFVIDARSQPGSLRFRIARPVARRFQRYATEAALDHFTSYPHS